MLYQSFNYYVCYNLNTWTTFSTFVFQIASLPPSPADSLDSGVSVSDHENQDDYKIRGKYQIQRTFLT